MAKIIELDDDVVLIEPPPAAAPRAPRAPTSRLREKPAEAPATDVDPPGHAASAGPSAGPHRRSASPVLVEGEMWGPKPGGEEGCDDVEQRRERESPQQQRQSPGTAFAGPASKSHSPLPPRSASVLSSPAPFLDFRLSPPHDDTNTNGDAAQRRASSSSIPSATLTSGSHKADMDGDEEMLGIDTNGDMQQRASSSSIANTQKPKTNGTSKPPSSTNINGADVNGDERTRTSSSSSLGAPPSTAGAPGPSQKPKSSKATKRSPSPEPLPPPPPPLQTIRLEIRVGGPDNYAIDVAQLARETGQRPPTPPPVKHHDTSDSEGEDDDTKKARGIGKGKGKAGKKKSLAAEYYDLNDPFIDDSELAVDERTYFAQTKQQGFYVSSGEVALMKDKSKDRELREHEKTPGKKPKSKKNIVPTIIPLAGSQAVNAAVATMPRPSVSTSTTTAASPTDPFGPPPPSTSSVSLLVHGTRETPITVSDNDASVSANGLKRKASMDGAAMNGKKKRKTVEIEMFHPELQAALHELKAAIAQESFEQKGKFPPTLKPLLARVALKAIVCGEYNENFFSLMPKLFIYNKFTMTKLIKRTVYADHQKLLLARQDELLEELRRLSEEGFGRAQEEYEKNVQAWERRQEKAKVEVASAEGTPVPGSATPSVNGATLPPPVTQDGGAESGVEGVTASAGLAASHSSQHMPTKRYRLTERMRNIIWELVVLSNESCRIENEKNTLENSTVQVSEQGTRKVLYQRIVQAFPDGWMSSGQISREVSVMKKRFEAQQAEES